MILNKYLLYCIFYFQYINTQKKLQLSFRNVKKSLIQSLAWKFNELLYTFFFFRLYLYNKLSKKLHNRCVKYFGFFKKKKKISRTPFLSNLFSPNKTVVYNYLYTLFGSTLYKVNSFALLEYTYLLQIYFYRIFSFFFNLNFINVSSIISYNLLTSVSNYLVKVTPRQFNFYYFTELSEVLLSGILSKNLYFLYRWIKFNLERRSIKMFLKFKYFLRFIFKSLFWNLKQILNLKGFFLKFKGKFLKGGGKKKKTIYRCGQYSGNFKSLRLVYKKFYIRTISGIIGCTLKVAY